MFFDLDKYQKEPQPKPPNTQERYLLRAKRWGRSPMGRARHYFWWVLHNSIVHPILGIIPCKLTHGLHDWASEKLNYGWIKHAAKENKKRYALKR